MSQSVLSSRWGLCLGGLLALSGCKKDEPLAPTPPAANQGSGPATATSGGEGLAGGEGTPPQNSGPLALAFQKVARPYGDIPMLGLDGTPKRLSEVATAKVVFMVPWFSIQGSHHLTFAEQVKGLLADVPEAQVLVFSADRAVNPEDREVLQSLVKEAGITVPVWTDRDLKLLAIVNASNPGARPAGNALWVAPLTAFSQHLEQLEPSHWDTDDLPALKEKLQSQVKRLLAEAAKASAATP